MAFRYLIDYDQILVFMGWFFKPCATDAHNEPKEGSTLVKQINKE